MKDVTGRTIALSIKCNCEAGYLGVIYMSFPGITKSHTDSVEAVLFTIAQGTVNADPLIIETPFSAHHILAMTRTQSREPHNALHMARTKAAVTDTPSCFLQVEDPTAPEVPPTHDTL